MRASNAVATLNKTMYRAIVKKAGVNGDKAVIIPNGVDVDYFKPGLRNDEFLSKFNLEEGNYILFVGRVSPEKGVHLLLKAFSYIAQESVHVKLVIAGPLTSSFSASGTSPYARAVVEYAKRRLPGRIIFTGSVVKDELRVLYSNAHLFVLPSLAEAFGLMLIEAVACGKPVLAFDIPPVNEIIVNGISGLLIKPSVESLTETLRIITDDTKALRAMGLKARNIVEMKYSWQVILRKYLILYKKLI